MAGMVKDKESVVDKLLGNKMIQGKNILKSCSGALFHKLREYLLDAPEFSSEEMEEILDSIVISEELE